MPRSLGIWSAVAVLVGSTIGSGIFRTPAGVAQKVEDVPFYVLAWVLGAVVALCGALTVAELAAAFPRSGGVYVFLRESFGPAVAFLFGWAELLIIRPGAYGAISITASAYTLRTFSLDPAVQIGGLPLRGDQALGAVFILIVALVNYFGLRRGAVLQNLSTAFKVGALLLLIALGLGSSAGEAVVGAGGMFGQRAVVEPTAFLLAMVSVLWAYDGWADLSFVGGEVRDPQRTLPRALLLGTAAVVVIYLGANLAYLHLLTIGEMQRAELVAAELARAVIGPAGGIAVAAAVAVSTFGTLNGSMMTSPRIFFAMAEDRLLPRAVGRVDARTGAPTGAVLLAAGLGMVFILIREFTDLAEQFVIGIWPFYALAVVGVFVLRRRRPDLPRPYRTIGYPLVPLGFLAGSAVLLGNYLVTETTAFVVDLAVIGVGLPVYWLIRRLGGGPAGR